MPNRREQAAELRSTWMVYEPAQAKASYSRKDFEDADDRARTPSTVTLTAADVCRFEVGYSRRVHLPSLARGVAKVVAIDRASGTITLSPAEAGAVQVPMPE